MNIRNNNLAIRQLDKKMQHIAALDNHALPEEGWVKTIRKTLNMSLRQLGKRMMMTPQSVRDIERREVEGTVTLKTLQDAARALDMKLVYGLVPKDGTLEKMIERRATEIATQIVKRTHMTMLLEEQGNSDERIQEAINELTDTLKREMPKMLWEE
ncbi:MAG: mobile mystery protein A [Bacteroidota bacterium]